MLPQTNSYLAFGSLETYIPAKTALAMLPFMEIVEVGMKDLRRRPRLESTYQVGESCVQFTPAAPSVLVKMPVTREETAARIALTVANNAGLLPSPAGPCAFADFVHEGAGRVRFDEKGERFQCDGCTKPTNATANFVQLAEDGQHRAELYPHGDDPQTHAYRAGAAYRLAVGLLDAHFLTGDELVGLKHFIAIAANRALATYCLTTFAIVSLGLREKYNSQPQAG